MVPKNDCMYNRVPSRDDNFRKAQGLLCSLANDCIFRRAGSWKYVIGSFSGEASVVGDGRQGDEKGYQLLRTGTGGLCMLNSHYEGEHCYRKGHGNRGHA